MKLKYLFFVLGSIIFVSCSKESNDEITFNEGVPETEVIECKLNVTLEQNLNESIIKAVPVDGASPFTYLWSTGASDELISDVTPGNYQVKIIDSDECESVFQFGLDFNLNCGGDFGLLVTYNENTSTLVSIIDSALDYNVIWSNGESTENILVESGNSYTIQVINLTGCVLIVTFDIP